MRRVLVLMVLMSVLALSTGCGLVNWTNLKALAGVGVEAVASTAAEEVLKETERPAEPKEAQSD